VTSLANLLVIFGATGDLAKRLLLPSLFGLERDGLLPTGLRILCTSRSQFSNANYHQEVADSLRSAPFFQAENDSAVRRLLDRLEYQTADLSDEGSLATLIEAIKDRREGDVLLHLSTAPNWYEPVCSALGRYGLDDPGVRIMLEKPIGRDLNDSVRINDAVGSVFAEHQIFRVDHYLGKDGVQNLLALRFGNALFEPVWNARHIDHVQLTVAETVGAGGRADYYDQYGALRDMVQNHMLQLLAMTAMEPPAQFNPTAVRNEKSKVLQSLRPISGPSLLSNSVAGQYGAGIIDGQPVPGYRDELGYDSSIETYVALRVHIDNWRWSGVPFYLRTGKRMPSRLTEILIQFREVPHSIFPAAQARMQPNRLVIRLQPEEHISLSLMNKTPGLDRNGLKLSQVALDLDLRDAFEDRHRRVSYERLYLDAIEGNGTLFVRRDEVEGAWRWVDEIIAGWREQELEPRRYAAGSWGPSSAVALTERNGHSWREETEDTP